MQVESGREEITHVTCFLAAIKQSCVFVLFFSKKKQSLWGSSTVLVSNWHRLVL